MKPWWFDYVAPEDRRRRLHYQDGGRERPGVDCFGYYRVLWEEVGGRHIDLFHDTNHTRAIRREIRRQLTSKAWIEIARMEGETLVFSQPERELDMVLMDGVIGRGEHTITVPFHCGAVTKAGWMTDMEIVNGVLHRPYRDTPIARAWATVRHSVLGVYRPVFA